jgi:hypothetical protein
VPAVLVGLELDKDDGEGELEEGDDVVEGLLEDDGGLADDVGFEGGRLDANPERI